MGQELETGLIQHIKTYEALETNEERDEHLRNIATLLKTFSKDSLEAGLNKLNFKPSKQQLFFIDFIKAENSRITGDYNTAKSDFDTLIEKLRTSEPIDNTFLSIAYLRLSHSHSFKNFSYLDGLKTHKLGLEYALKSGVHKTIMHFHSNISFYYGRLGDDKKKVFHNREAYELAVSVKDTAEFVMSNSSYMNHLIVSFEPESALKIWEDMRPYIHKVKFKNAGKSILFAEVARAFIFTEQLDSANYYVNSIIEMDRLAGRAFRQSSNAILKGRILLREEKLKEALSVYKTAYSDAKERKNYIDQFVSAMGANVVLFKEERYAEAETMLREAYKNKSFFRSYNKGELQEALADVFEKQNQLDSALSYRKKADISFKGHNKQKSDRQLALAKVELEIDDFIKENQDLTASNSNLNQQVSKTTATKNIIIYSFLGIIGLVGVFLYHRRQKEKLRISQHREQLSMKERIAIEAELNTIRSQMNPHFMFNSLNSINEFIQNDSGEDASNYLVKFSRLMRLTLNYSKRKFVTLEEEVDLLKLYVDLENLRFYNSIDFSLKIHPAISIKDILIPPMMIQPFAENAIWHGLMAKDNDRKLNLSFYENADNLICEIQDNGIGRAASAKHNLLRDKHKSQGIGLTKRRLELLKSIYGKEAGIEVVDLETNGSPSGTLVKVILPIQMNI